jgi:hypothetical protein
MSIRWAVGVVSGYVAGVVWASRSGMPFGHLLLLTLAVLTIVLMVVLPNIQDAATRRFQAATDRKVQLGHCPSCRASLVPKEAAAADERWWRRWWARLNP